MQPLCRQMTNPCDTSGKTYSGNESFGGRTMTSPEVCQQRCKDTPGCRYFNAWADEFVTSTQETKIRCQGPLPCLVLAIVLSCVILQDGNTFLEIWLVRGGLWKHPHKGVSSVVRTPRDANISPVTLMGVVISRQEKKERRKGILSCLALSFAFSQQRVQNHTHSPRRRNCRSMQSRVGGNAEPS